jgi:hypothetical protein
MAGRLLPRLFVRVPVRAGRVFLGSFAVLVRRARMGFRLVMLALRMLMRRLMMMMGGGLVSGSGVVMMLLRRMLGRLCHLIFPFRVYVVRGSCRLTGSTPERSPRTQGRDYLASAIIPECAISSVFRVAMGAKYVAVHPQRSQNR